MKKIFGFSRLSRSPKIYLIYFYFITSTDLGANGGVLKCCPQDQVISVADGYTCAHYDDHNENLYLLRNREDRDRDLFLCGNLTSKMRSEITDIGSNTNMEINVRNTCVDLLYNASKSKSVLYQCFDESNIGDESKKVRGEIDRAKPLFERATFKTLRMCCGKNQNYDRELRECKMREKYDRFLGFNFWSRLVDSIDFVTVVAGPLECKSALLDYVIDVRTNLRVLSNDSIEIVLPTNDGPWKILVEEEHTCLDFDKSDPFLMTVRTCCGAQFCRKDACVPKCCPDDEFYGKQRCVKKPSHASKNTCNTCCIIC